MPATDPAPARCASDPSMPRQSVAHRKPAILTPVLLLILLAAACRPVGWDVDPTPPPPPMEAVDLDDSADGAGEPAGVEELLGWVEEEEAGEEVVVVETVPLVLDAEAITRDLLDHFPGFLAGGFPDATLEGVLRYVGMFHDGRARANFERWLARESRYRDLILTELEAAGLPEELLYLAMLESGFSPTAVSRAGAVGLWQFMAATGRAEGLRIDEWVDERRDPIASTRAAIKHLTMLHRELGDWALAAAAYNSGLGRVRRARGATGAGYFDLTRAGRLPAETRSYVPLILATSHVARNREYYGFHEIEPEPPLRYDTLHVEARTRLSAVARVTGLELAEITALNTHLVRGAAPPVRDYPVRVPAGIDLAGVGERLAALSVDERLLPEYREIWAVVRSGDSWWRIANQHGVTVGALRARNPRVGDVIHPGQRLLVDRRQVTDSQAPARATTGSSATVAAATPRPTAATTRSPGPSAGAAPQPPANAAYRVRRGDTMSGLAATRGVTAAELARWNGMPAPRPLREGEVIRLAPPGPRTHRVERGETLTSVARRYGVDITDLVRWNSMSSARPLREGETLVVDAG